MNEVQNFLLEDAGLRGALVRLTDTWRHVIAEHEYAPEVRELLGEGVAATVLLASGLKAQPSVSLQLQGDGPLKLLLIQCSKTLKVRGMAQAATVPEAEPLLGAGKLVVNVDTGATNGFFQGIVPLASHRLDRCLEAYFERSEQLPTRLLLSCTQNRVAGLLLQVLPGRDEELGTEEFAAAAAAAETLRTAELATLPAEELLPKVFAGRLIRLFSAKPVEHDCRCTPERLAGVLRMLGAEELHSLLAEQGHVELNCEFCNRAFRYHDSDVQAILNGAAVPSSLVH
jgi:molecular chaperone Hsp33